MTGQTNNLVERLRLIAKQHSETSRMMAQSKSLRQEGHDPPRDDLYMWATPEQTTEWQAADALQSLSARIAVLEGLQRQIIAQYRVDLSTAHAEICKLQKLDPATHSWPDWTPQANSLRWFDELERASITKEGTTSG